MSKYRYSGEHRIVNKWFMLTEYADKRITEICTENEGKFAKITFEVVSKRSQEANAFYWSSVIDGYKREWPDYTTEAIHRILGQQFRRQHRDKKEIAQLKKLFFAKNPDGKWLDEYEFFVQPSSEMKVYDFWVYTNQCIQQLMDIGGMLTPTDAEKYAILQGKYKKVKP